MISIIPKIGRDAFMVMGAKEAEDGTDIFFLQGELTLGELEELSEKIEEHINGGL
jgi:hypothetical protein